MNIAENTEIKLSEIDWNKLSPEEFKKVNEHLLERENARKKTEKKKRVSSDEIQIVKMRGYYYQVKMKDYQHLIRLKSKKARDKFIDSLIGTTEPYVNFDFEL